MRKTMGKSLRALLAVLTLVGTVTLGPNALGADVASAQPPRPAGPRLRLGLEAGGGGEWGRPRGVAVGVFGQLGIQLADRIAIFYQPALFAHALSTTDHADAFVAWGNLGMLDLTFGLVQLGVGGGVDVGKFASCSSSSNCVAGSRTVDPALGGRLAVVLSLRGLRGRIGIPFAFHVHTTFLDSSQRLTAMILTVGIQHF